MAQCIIKPALFLQFLILTSVVALANPISIRPEPFAADPYRRIGATAEMPEAEVRRAYIRALNEFDPEISGRDTHREYEHVLEAGRSIFGQPGDIAAPQSHRPTAEEIATIADLNLARNRKLVRLAGLETRPKPTPVSKATSDLRSALHSLRREKNAAHGWKFKESLADVHETLAKQRLQWFSAEERQQAVDAFIQGAVRRNHGTFSIEDVVGIDRFAKATEARIMLYSVAIYSTKSPKQVLELLLACFGSPQHGAASPELAKEILRYSNSQLKLLKKWSAAEPPNLLSLLLWKVASDPAPKHYDAGVLFKSLAPYLRAHLSPEIIRVLSHIRLAPWLPFRATAWADGLLRDLQGSKIAKERGLSGIVDAALSPQRKAPRRPLSQCLLALTHKLGHWLN